MWSSNIRTVTKCAIAAKSFATVTVKWSNDINTVRVFVTIVRIFRTFVDIWKPKKKNEKDNHSQACTKSQSQLVITEKHKLKHGSCLTETPSETWSDYGA